MDAEVFRSGPFANPARVQPLPLIFRPPSCRKDTPGSVVFESKGADREGRRGRRWEGRDPCQPWLGINVLQGAEKAPEEGRDLIRGPWRPCKQTERGAMAVRIAA